MRICDLPEEQITIGLRVWNAKKTQKGRVTHLNPDTRNGLDVGITWDNGEESLWWASGLTLELAIN